MPQTSFSLVIKSHKKIVTNKVDLQYKVGTLHWWYRYTGRVLWNLFYQFAQILNIILMLIFFLHDSFVNAFQIWTIMTSSLLSIESVLWFLAHLDKIMGACSLPSAHWCPKIFVQGSLELPLFNKTSLDNASRVSTVPVKFWMQPFNNFF